VSDPTVLVSPEALAGRGVRLEGAGYRHLFRARRLPVGAVVRVVDGAGGTRAAVVASVDRRGAELRLGERLPSRDPARAVTVLVAAPRPERAAWMVEKLTELGVVAVRLLAAEHATRDVAEGKLARLRRVAVSALEQCGGSRLPELSGPHALRELPALIAGAGLTCHLDPGAAAPLAPAGDGAAGVLVGPEGGWSPGELALFRELGLTGATLGPRLLRVETAAVASAALLLLGAPGLRSSRQVA
jgi:16S rRNA (uracil1498-N3)-methyltransferase